MHRYALFISVAIMGLLACAPPPPPGSRPSEWERSYWVIRRIRGWEVSHRATLHLEADGSYVASVYGRTWVGGYWETLNSVAPGRGLRFSMPEKPMFGVGHPPWRNECWYCDDMEESYLEALVEVSGYTHEGRDLVLLGRDGDEILAFRAKY